MTLADSEIDELRAQIGASVQLIPRDRIATRDAIWQYVCGLGDDNPLWYDPGYASGTRWGGIIAPPSYLYTADRGTPRPGQLDPADVRDSLLPRVPSAWAGSRWTWHRPVAEGDAVESTWTLSDVTVKESSSRGRTARQVERYEHRNGATGELLAEEERLVVRRRPPAPEETELASAGAARSPAERIVLPGSTPRRGSKPLDINAVAPGDELGCLVKGPLTTMSLVNWLVGWGVPVGFNDGPLHEYLRDHPSAGVYDPGAGTDIPREARHLLPHLARGAGFAGGYDFGAMRIGWMIQLLTDWMGDDAWLALFDARLLAPNPVGTVSFVRGTIASVEQDRERPAVHCDIIVEDEAGTQLARGRGVVELPTEDNA